LIKKDSNKEEAFIKALISGVEQLDVSCIRSKEELQIVVLCLADIFENAWS